MVNMIIYIRIFLVGVCAVSIPVTAYAYLDPNTGGILYQIAFPIIVAVAATWKFLKIFIAKLISKLLKLFG